MYCHRPHRDVRLHTPSIFNVLVEVDPGLNLPLLQSMPSGRPYVKQDSTRACGRSSYTNHWSSVYNKYIKALYVDESKYYNTYACTKLGISGVVRDDAIYYHKNGTFFISPAANKSSLNASSAASSSSSTASSPSSPSPSST